MSNILKLQDSTEKQLRRRIRELDVQRVTISQYLTFGLMRELGASLDELKRLKLFKWSDYELDKIESFYQDEKASR